MLISMSNFEMANDRLDYSNEKNKVNKDDESKSYASPKSLRFQLSPL